MDVLEGKYLGVPLIIILKSGEKIITQIDGYTHDEEPFINYIEVRDREIPFNEIKTIELQ